MPVHGLDGIHASFRKTRTRFDLLSCSQSSLRRRTRLVLEEYAESVSSFSERTKSITCVSVSCSPTWARLLAVSRTVTIALLTLLLAPAAAQTPPAPAPAPLVFPEGLPEWAFNIPNPAQPPTPPIAGIVRVPGSAREYDAAAIAVHESPPTGSRRSAPAGAASRGGSGAERVRLVPSDVGSGPPGICRHRGPTC